VLVGQDFGGGHEDGLETVQMGNIDSDGGDNGFAGADVTLEQTVHRLVFGEIGQDSLDGLILGRGEGERKFSDEL